MKVEKRNGTQEILSLNKILYRIRKICNDKQFGKLKSIDPDLIAQKVSIVFTTELIHLKLMNSQLN